MRVPGQYAVKIELGFRDHASLAPSAGQALSRGTPPSEAGTTGFAALTLGADHLPPAIQGPYLTTFEKALNGAALLMMVASILFALLVIGRRMDIIHHEGMRVEINVPLPEAA